MMVLPIRIEMLAAVIALAALAGCVRNGPPAPVSMQDGAQASGQPPGLPPPSPAQTREPAAIAAPNVPPKPPAATAQSHAAHPDQVVVGKGETLYMISRRYDLPLRSIIDANHLNPPYALATGTNLVLPQERFHVVQAGETLYAVSRLYGVDVTTLASLNHLAAPFGIRSGQTLLLPPQTEPAERVAIAPPRPDNASSSSLPERAEPAPPNSPAPPQATAPQSTRPRGGRVFAWPLEGRIIESYGTGPSGTHNDGINIAARAGEPVRAADNGTVAYAGNELRGYGNLVLVKHPGGYMTAYAHNAKLLVRRGEVVKRGQQIAVAGSTGTVSSPQLHFEIRQGTRALDPINYLPSLSANAN